MLHMCGHKSGRFSSFARPTNADCMLYSPSSGSRNRSTRSFRVCSCSNTTTESTHKTGSRESCVPSRGGCTYPQECTNTRTSAIACWSKAVSRFSPYVRLRDSSPLEGFSVGLFDRLAALRCSHVLQCPPCVVDCLPL